MTQLSIRRLVKGMKHVFFVGFCEGIFHAQRTVVTAFQSENGRFPIAGDWFLTLMNQKLKRS